MKFSSLSLTTLFVYGSSASDTITWQTGSFGNYLTCPSGQYIQGYCSSGRNANCDTNGQSSYTKVGCSDYPVPEATAEQEPESINGWLCASFGTLLECPQGYIMTGACGAGENPNCVSYCSSPEYSAILCEPAPASSAAGPNEGTWSEPLGFGKTETCPEGQVMCGVCQSGGNNNCQGAAWRQKCCDIEPYQTKGSWIGLFSVAAPTTYTSKLAQKSRRRSRRLTSGLIALHTLFRQD